MCWKDNSKIDIIKNRKLFLTRFGNKLELHKDNLEFYDGYYKTETHFYYKLIAKIRLGILIFGLCILICIFLLMYILLYIPLFIYYKIKRK